MFIALDQTVWKQIMLEQN